MPTETAYSRLPLRPARYDDRSLEPLHIDDEGTPDEAYGDTPRPGRPSEAFYWRLFIASCIVALALSAINLTALSAWTTFTTLLPSARPAAPEPKRPSPYLGLEKVAVEPSSCRSRATFPKRFYTYDTRGGSNAGLTRVHAPGDQATLIFGGPVRLAAHSSIAISHDADWNVSGPRCRRRIRGRLRPRELHAASPAEQGRSLPPGRRRRRGSPALRRRSGSQPAFHIPRRPHVRTREGEHLAPVSLRIGFARLLGVALPCRRLSHLFAAGRRHEYEYVALCVSCMQSLINQS